ncbi:MAG: Hint domain-containing protein [Acetobacteraceae bacterium]|nr:Hint domain-containing protein [Acetobacteraceae bacterium]
MSYTLSGTYSSGVTLTSGSQNPVTISPFSLVTSSTGAALYGPAGPGYTWTIDNSGTIAGPPTYTGVQLGSNSGTIDSGVVTNRYAGLIVGANGVYINGSGTLTNLSGGTITGTVTAGVDLTGAAGTVTNYGVLQGYGSNALGVIESGGGAVSNQVGGLISGYEGVAITGPGVVTNSGTIIGTQTAGIELASSPGTVVNYGLVQGYGVAVLEDAGGTVTNQSGGTIAGNIGVEFVAAGTFTDAGAVIGNVADAVEFNASVGENRLILAPTATFTGNISSALNGDNVVELQAGGAGTLSTFGTNITNFSSLQFDPGATWTVTGDDSNAGLGTIVIDGFGLGNTIDLTGFAATSETFADNVLTLSDGITTETLQIVGSFATGDFQLASDQNGGVLITEGALPASFNWIGGTDDWTTASGWDPTGVPGNIDTATIAEDGINTVSIATAEHISVAMVALSGPTDVLEIDGTLAVSGTLTVTGGTIDLMATGLVNGGTIADTTGTALVATGGTFDQVTWQGPLNIASDGASLQVVDGLTVTGLDGTSPGTIDVTGLGDTLQFAAGVSANGQLPANTTINIGNAASADTIEASFGGGTFTIGSDVTIASTDGGALADLTLDSGTGAILDGTIIASASGGTFTIADGPAQTTFENNGILAVSNDDTLDVTIAIDAGSGSGTIDIASGGIASFSASVASDQTLFFTDGTGKLRLSDPTDFQATISGFDAGGTIDLAGIAADGATWNSGTLTITEGVSTVGTLLMTGDFSNEVFQVVGDGATGTFINAMPRPTSFAWNAGSDDWNTAADWTPSYLPWSGADATIANPGTYIVTIGTAESVAAASVTLDNATATLLVLGGLTSTGTIGITAGTLDAVGSLSAVSISDSGVLAFTGSQTLTTPLSLGTNGTLLVQDVDVLTPATLTLAVGETITQTGTAAVIGSTSLGGEQVVNLGTINATVSGGGLTIDPLGFTNDGTINVGDGASLTLAGQWNNADGTVAVTGTAAINLGGSFTTKGVGTFNGASGVTLYGTLDNRENALSVGTGEPLGTVTLAAGGTIVGGTIADQGNGFVFSSGTFDGVTYDGATLAVNGDLNVTNGLVVMGAEGVGDGTIDLGGTGVSVLDFVGSQALDNATVHLDGTGLSAVAELESGGANASVLTFGTDLLIDSSTIGAHGTIGSAGTTEIVNRGTILAQAKGGMLQISPVDGLSNQGFIEASNGDTLVVGSGVVGGTGTIEVATGGVATFMAGVTANQTIVFGDTSGTVGFAQPDNVSATIAGFDTGGTIDLKSIAADSATWVAGSGSNPGTLTITEGVSTVGTLRVTGDFSNEVFQVGTDGATGTFINAIPRPTAFAWNDGSADWNTAADWTPGYLPWALADTTIAHAGTYIVTIGSKESVAVASVTLGNATATLLVQGSLASTGTIGITAGTLNAVDSLSAASISDSGVLAFTGSRTLTAPLSLGTNGTLLVQDVDALTPATLTLAVGETITQTGTAAVIGSTSLGGEQIINLGTINATVSGGLTIDPLGFTNDGIINLGNGASLTLGGQWNNTSGTVAVTGTATINLGGLFTTKGVGTFTGATGVTLYGTLDNTENGLFVGTGEQLGTMTLTGGGTIVGGSIYDHGNGFVFSHGTFDGVTYHSATGLSVLGDLNVTDGLVVMGAEGGTGTIALGGAGASILDFVGSQTLDNATVHLDGTGSVAELESGGTGGSVLTLGANLLIDSAAIGAQGTIGSAGATEIVNLGTILASAHDGTLQIAPVNGLSNQGLIAVTNRDTVVVGTAVVGGDGTIEVAAGGFATFMAGVAASQGIVFADASGTVGIAQPSNVAGTISGFRPGDIIDLKGIAADVATWTKGAGSSPGTLTVSNGGNTVAALAVSGDYTNIAFSTTSDGAGGTDVTATSLITPCFAAGTRIATTRGAVAVERLKEGDVVLTVSGGRQPIAWIGHRQVDCRRHPAKDRVWPIRVAPHAFGEGRPKRALLLSPDHAVFVEGVLIPIKFLLNGTTIRQVEVDTVTYYHVELPRHDVLLAEGLPAESYLETGGRNAFANSGLPMQLHPDFEPDPVRVAMVWQNFGYAPLIGDEATVERARAKLQLQAMLLEAMPVKPARKPRRTARAA